MRLAEHNAALAAKSTVHNRELEKEDQLLSDDEDDDAGHGPDGEGFASHIVDMPRNGASQCNERAGRKPCGEGGFPKDQMGKSARPARARTKARPERRPWLSESPLLTFI